MFCTHCGREIPDGQTCPCQAEAANHPPVGNMPPVGYPGGPRPVCAVNPVVATVKTIGRSIAFLWTCILFTVSTVLQIFNSIWSLINSSVQYDYFNDYEFEFDFDLSFILPIFVCIGLWMIYNTCKSDHSPMVQSSGLSMVRAIQIVELVLVCLGTVVVALFAFVMLTMGSAPFIADIWDEFIWEFNSYLPSSEWATMLSGIIVLILLGALVGFVFAIVYFVKLIKTLKIIGQHFCGMLTPQSISQFVIVATYIFGAIQLLGALGNLTEWGSFWELAAGAASAAACFVLGTELQRYKKQMDQLWLMSMASVPAPSAAQPFGQPAPSVFTAQAPVSAPATAPVQPEPETNSQPAASQPKAVETAPTEASEQEEQQTTFCSSCGKPLAADEKYCTQCGQPANR